MSKDRQQRLMECVIVGEEAEIVLRHAKQWFLDQEQKLLRSIRSGAAESSDQDFYRACHSFYTEIKSIADRGMRKAEKLRSDE